jgi:hypothetical protein
MSMSLDMRGPLTARALLVAVVVGVVAWMLCCTPASEAAGSCPNEGLRTGSSAALPDCRAYEMVSPPNKNGGEVDGGIHKGAMAAPEQAAADGEAVTYGSTSAFIEAEPPSAVVTSQYLSTRTADGWRTREIVPKQQLPEGKLETLGEGAPDFSLFQGFGEDLEDGFLLAWNPQPDPLAPAGYFNPYLFDGGSDGYQILSEEVTPPAQSPGQDTLEGPGFGAVYGGMSTNGRHVIFEANDALTPGAVPGRVNLYEWSAGRPLELVSVLPEGSVDTSGSQYPIGSGSSMTFGAPAPGNFEMPSLDGALSSSGTRAFWSGGITTGNQLYMHEITGSGARTVDISESQKSGQPVGGGEYWAATPEGSLVYFTSDLQLTSDSAASTGDADLYQYDANTGELSDLTVDPNAGEKADVQGVLGIGESAGEPYVYFVAGGVLASNETSEGGKAVPQTCQPQIAATPATPCNLYVYHGGQTAFVATLGGFKGELQDFQTAVKQRTSRVSPDGQLLAFQSAEPLTGYDNIPANGQSCPQPVREGEKTLYSDLPEGRCMEVFEYDAQSSKLTCVSCEPGGLPPTGDSLVPETPHLYENVRGWESSTVQQRYLLNDGRLYFQSEDALLPQATNGHQNIYEYEPEGVGQCAISGVGGCQYLISTGESSASSYFVDASADGRDVFFLTNERLVPQDGDGAIDMYDAREGGGFSSATPPPCSGEACKPAVTPAPAIYGAPSSATFQGAGDIPAQSVVTPSTKTTKQTQAKKKKKKHMKSKKKPRAKRKITKRAARGPARRSEQGRR